MKQRLMSILLISIFLVCSFAPMASAGSLSFDEAALTHYLDAWQQKYTAEGMNEIDLEDALLGDDETWGFLVYGRDCTLGYDFDTSHFFAIIPAEGDFRVNLKDMVFYAEDEVIHHLNLEYDEDMGYLVELSDDALDTLLNCDEFTIRLSYSDTKTYIDFARSAHEVLYQMARHVNDAVDYCAYSSKQYQAAALLPDGSAQAPAAPQADVGFVNDYVAINQRAQSMFLVEIYNEKDQAIATGSGFVAFDGHLFITNHHVIDEAAYLVVYDDVGNAHMIETLIAADEQLDIAILEFDAGFEYDALALQAHPTLLRGQPVIAIGSPKGVKNTVSSGNISALLQENGAEIIQFTAPASHGSSGGALFDNAGNVIGLVFAKHTEGENMNYALNIQWVIDFYQQHAHQPAQALAAYNHLVAAPQETERVNRINSLGREDAPAQTPTGEYAVYTHPVLGYSLEYPAGWVVMDSSTISALRRGESGLDLSGLDWDEVAPQIEEDQMAAFADYRGVSSNFDLLDFSANITVNMSTVGDHFTAEEILELVPDLQESFRQSLEGIEFMNDGVVYEAGGREFCLLGYSYPNDGYDLYAYQFYIADGYDLYLIELTLAENVFDLEAVEGYTDHLLATLVFP